MSSTRIRFSVHTPGVCSQCQPRMTSGTWSAENPYPFGRPPRDAGAMLRIGVISDTHGLLRPQVERCLAGVAHIVHAGPGCCRWTPPDCACCCDQRECRYRRLGGAISGDPDANPRWTLHLFCTTSKHSGSNQSRAGLTSSFAATRIGPGSRLFAGCSISIREVLGHGVSTCQSLWRLWI
jgi:hypothetical protein